MPGNKKKEIAAEPGALESEAGVQTEEQEQVHGGTHYYSEPKHQPVHVITHSKITNIIIIINIIIRKTIVILI